MHPIERLRHVARAGGAPADEVFRAAAASLAGFASEPMALVTAAKRLVERHPENAPVWWLCSRVLSAGDPHDEAWRCLDLWVSDRTSRELGHSLPDHAVVVVVGSPDRLLPALSSRGDLSVVSVDVEGDAYGFVRRLDAADVRAETVDVVRLGPAVAAADLVLLDAIAVGTDAALTAPGSWPVAAVAHTSGVPVWMVAGVGRSVTSRTWTAMRELAADQEHRVAVDPVSCELVGQVVGETGLEDWASAHRRGEPLEAAALLR